MSVSPHAIPRTNAQLAARGIRPFLNRTAIASSPDPSKWVRFWWYAIEVLKNALAPRVFAFRSSSRAVKYR